MKNVDNYTYEMELYEWSLELWS